MTDQDNLRNRIAEIVNAALDAWNTDMGTQDGESEYTAQAIIEEFGLTVETHAATHAKRNMTRITGAWEWEKQ